MNEEIKMVLPFLFAIVGAAWLYQFEQIAGIIYLVIVIILGIICYISEDTWG